MRSNAPWSRSRIDVSRGKDAAIAASRMTAALPRSAGRRKTPGQSCASSSPRQFRSPRPPTEPERIRGSVAQDAVIDCRHHGPNDRETRLARKVRAQRSEKGRRAMIVDKVGGGPISGAPQSRAASTLARSTTARSASPPSMANQARNMSVVSGVSPGRPRNRSAQRASSRDTKISRKAAPRVREFGESVLQNAPHHLADQGRDVDGLRTALFGLVQATLRSAQPQP